MLILLSDNDWNSLAVSLRKMNEIILTRQIGDIYLEASTEPVKKAWPVAMVISIRIQSPRVVQRQHFESVESARKTIEGWSFF